MTTDATSDRILRFVAAPEYRPVKLRTLARQMEIADRAYADFRDAVKTLTRRGRLSLGAGQTVRLGAGPDRIIGRFRRNVKGFGFVIPENAADGDDLFVPASGAGDAATGDIVAAKKLNKGKRGGRFVYEGRIVEVIERKHGRVVGRLGKIGPKWLVHVDGGVFVTPVIVDDVGAKNARSGDQVIVEMVEYPTPDEPGRGVIAEVLGRSSDPDADTRSIIHQFDLPTEFPKACLDSAREIVDAFDADAAAAEREDLRGLTCITIDPKDARDYDDAISIERLADDGFRLGVHIADVATFVPVETALDDEARSRGNSVYLPRHVIPMLPELLSNGLCSLQENQPRLTKSAFIDLDADGAVQNARFANAIIQSTKRLTYEDAQRALDGKTGGLSRKVVQLLKDADDLARRIRGRRLRDGMLVLDLPEVVLEFDDDGKMLDAHPADDSFTHKIIEMFMVEANEAVARLFNGLGASVIRRVHPAPEPAAAEKLSQFLARIGHQLPRQPGRKDLQQLLDGVRGEPESFVINLAVLKSMQAAEYAPRTIGHYALASEHYLHFTSPIRRYPDLTVHRMLDAYVRGDLKKRRKSKDTEPPADLVELADHCSKTERNAESAEKELRTMKVLRWLSERLGESHPGVITHVANYGVFVQLNDCLTEGLLRFEDMEDDWWEVDAQAGFAWSEHTNRRLRLGDAVSVRIAAVDVHARRLDLTLDKTGKAKKSRSSQSRSSSRPSPKSQKSSKPKKRGKPKSRTGGKPKTHGKAKPRSGGKRRRRG